MESDLKNLYLLNKAYQETITLTLEKLRIELNQNLQRQAEIQILLSTKQEKENYSFETEIAKIKDNYFKYKYSNVPPPNKDTLLKRDLVICEDVPLLQSEWNAKSRDTLKKSVITDAIRLLKVPCLNKMQVIEDKLKKLRRLRSHKEVIEAEDALDRVNSELNVIDQLSEMEILDKVDINRINWDKIANKDLQERWSGNACRLVWINAVNPRINREKWTPDEDERLRKLARKFREKNWVQIAIELNTGRSSYLCMKQYHEKTSLLYCRRDWSDEELNELLSLAAKYSIGHYVPYNYLCYLIGTRDRPSLYCCFLKINPNYQRGKWKDEEERLLIEAMTYYNKKFNWQEISEMVGTRSPFQCKEHYELKYNNPDKYVNWSMEDDIMLLEAYEKHKSHWTKIARELKNRNDHSCLFRFRKLMNWRKQMEWLDRQPPEVKEFIEWACKNNKATANMELEIGYTSSGELVPRIPAFMSSSSFMNGIVDKVHENMAHVFEFIRQKREGQLNLALLGKIGVQTQVTMALTRKYQKPMKVPKKRGRKPKLRLAVEASKQKPKPIEVVQQTKPAIQTTLPAPTTKRKFLETGATVESKPKRRRISKEAKIAVADVTSKAVLKKSGRKKKAEKALTQERPKTLVKIAAKIAPEVKVHTETPVKQTPMPMVMVPLLLIPAPKEKKQENQSENKNQRRRSSTKTPTIRNSLKAIQNNEADVKPERIVQTKITDRFKKVDKPAPITVTTVEPPNFKQSSLIMRMEDVSDDVKIPCLVEQSSGFQFLYSLKKDSSTYLDKYTIINCRGKPVGIKPLNHYVSDEYLTDSKLDEIEKSIKKILIKRIV